MRGRRKAEKYERAAAMAAALFTWTDFAEFSQNVTFAIEKRR